MKIKVDSKQRLIEPNSVIYWQYLWDFFWFNFKKTQPEIYHSPSHFPAKSGNLNIMKWKTASGVASSVLRFFSFTSSLLVYILFSLRVFNTGVDRISVLKVLRKAWVRRIQKFRKNYIANFPQYKNMRSNFGISGFKH